MGSWRSDDRRESRRDRIFETVLASQATLQFPSAGGYRVVADLNGESRNYGFIVVDEVTPS